MQQALVTVMGAAIMLGLGMDGLHACGDKFLMVGRGPRFHKAYAAIYPASIVIYVEPQRTGSAAIRDARFQMDLKLAGHRVSLVENEGMLTQTLGGGKVDLVLTDVRDAEHVAQLAASSPSHPTVMPVMYEPTSQETKALDAKSLCRLKSSDRADRYLIAIDDAMKTRLQQGRRKVS